MNSDFEKYLNEMMEMHRKAAPAQIPQETTFVEVESVQDNGQEENREKVENETYEKDEELSPKKRENSLFSQLSARIGFCEFLVENASDGSPVGNAQIMLFCSDGFLVRALTNKNGSSGEIPVIAEGSWRVSITASGYISVSKAVIVPVAGEKTSIAVKLDKSMSIDGIFAERSGS